MSNGRAIKRGIAQSQEQMVPEAQGPEPMAPQGGDREQSLAMAEEASGYDGRGEHILGMLNEQGVQDMNPESMEQLDMMNAALVDLIYHPKTKAAVQKSLQSAEPELSVPATVNMVMRRFEDFTRQKNGEMPLEMKLATGIMAFNEIVTLSSAMGIVPKKMNEQESQQLLQSTIQQYIQMGLKEKTIDPVELQLAIEPLLTPEEQLLGRGMGDEMGVPQAPTNVQMGQGVIDKKMMPLQVHAKNLEAQNKQMTGALEGIARSEGEA